MYDWVNNHSECFLCLPDIAKSSKGCLRLSRVSSAMMSSIKNKVLDPAKRLPIFSIELYRLLPGSIKMTSGSVQTHFQFLYVSLCFNVGQIIIMKSE